MEIYLDVIIMENIIMNYIILLVTSRFLKTGTSKGRLFLGALVGTAYVVLMVMMPDIRAYFTAAAKIILSFAIIAVTFSPARLGAFLKTLAIFYIVTFVFAGASFAFLYFNQTGGFVRNGIVYIYAQSQWYILLLAAVTALIILRVFWEILQLKLVKDKLLKNLKISFEDRIIDVSALVDTGNSLHDPISNLPVVVVEFRAIKDILPFEIQGIFAHSCEKDLSRVTNIISNSSWYSRFRLIPFTSLGKENGMLIGFKPDFIKIEDSEKNKSKGVKDVIVGIYNRSLSKGEDYKALLSPELV